jgi:glycogen operon protein
VPDAGGVNFSLYSESATTVELLLFERPEDPLPAQVIALDPDHNRTFVFWHVYVRGFRTGQGYAYRVHGPWDPAGRGHRFDHKKVLLDPYARGCSMTRWQPERATGPGDDVASAMRGVVVGVDGYDWEGDEPLGRPMSETIIYEVHPAGFTRSPTSGCRERGTFSALVEKIPYLVGLGVTAVELLPVFQFDDRRALRPSPVDGRPLVNYWGYSPIGFFLPHAGYCVSSDPEARVREFRDMVKAMHRAGVEVLLDVVFNHTEEGDEAGPTFSFRGLENAVYYMLDPRERQRYLNFSGCGNTVNANHPVVGKLILEALEYWVKEMHVDGFRFDEGTILMRGEDGAVMSRPPVVWQIELSEALSASKVIAECWDAGGSYQLGYFPGYRWAEWNGRYRDDIRRFVRGDRGRVGKVAASIAGSADMFQARGLLPVNSINFVTCHDGFTLNDLVSYERKHNEANGEGNRDGFDDNLSWSCGCEGPTDDPAIEALREQQIKNFATLVLLSQGVPMIMAGDEVRRTQHGNNNAYCQDNETSWFDWTLPEKHAGLLRFFRAMIAFRKSHYILHRRHFLTCQQTNARGVTDMSWHGCKLFCPGWEDPGSAVLALTLGDRGDGADLHIMLDMDGQDLEFEVPVVVGRGWYRAVDTSLPSPLDIAEPGAEQAAPGRSYLVKAHSVVILLSKDGPGAPPRGPHGAGA